MVANIPLMVNALETVMGWDTREFAPLAERPIVAIRVRPMSLKLGPTKTENFCLITPIPLATEVEKYLFAIITFTLVRFNKN